MSRPILLPLLASAVLALGCGSHKQNASLPAPDARAVVMVDNRSFLDMDVFVYDGNQRVRLGTAAGHSVTELTIPPRLLTGATPLRFIADPIGGRRAPVSDEIVVNPGDEVTLIIPPT